MAIVLLLDFLPLPSMTLKYSCPSPPDVMLKMDQNEITLWDKYPFFLKDKETSTDLDQLVYLQQALFWEVISQIDLANFCHSHTTKVPNRSSCFHTQRCKQCTPRSHPGDWIIRTLYPYWPSVDSRPSPHSVVRNLKIGTKQGIVLLTVCLPRTPRVTELVPPKKQKK